MFDREKILTLNNYNNANRLSSMNVDGTLAATYTYNPLGQRVMKTLANGATEIYHYDEAGQLIAVTDGAGVTTREYIYWGNQLISFVANGNIYYAHTDHLNTPQVITNQSQQVVWMGDYEPFGKLAQNQSNSIEIFSRFPGQYLDQETNLYYNYFRDYDPSIGRYIESDPIGLNGGINTYGYAYQNPLKFVDPLGLAPDCYVVKGEAGFADYTVCKPGTSPYPPGYSPSGDNSVYPGSHNDRTEHGLFFKYHGNWCGPGWTGGQVGSYTPSLDKSYTTPFDKLDSACKNHDICYASCRQNNPCDSNARGQCMTSCDRKLASEAAMSGHQYSSPLYYWMENNNSPDAGPNDSSCGCSP